MISLTHSLTHNSCTGDTNRNNSILYQWTPSNECIHPLSKFDRNEVCRLMRGRTLVFIGDSLSLHHYETTVSAIGSRYITQFYPFLYLFPHQLYGYRTVFSNKSDGHHHASYTQPYSYCEKLKIGSNYNVCLSFCSIYFSTIHSYTRLL